MNEIKTTRFSGLEWASEIKEIMMVGIGGIGSYTSFNLARIGHELLLVDGDSVDETNVTGGQLYRNKDVGSKKVNAVHTICREFGCTGKIWTVDHMFNEDCGMNGICICGLDNMEARKQVFEAWEDYINSETYNDGNGKLEFIDKSQCLFIDGRLIAELWEVFAIPGDRDDLIAEYKEKWLFDDSEVDALDCTAKQTSFVAMGIASVITGTLCNWLTNKKLGADMRCVPFHQMMFYPLFKHDVYSPINELV